MPCSLASPPTPVPFPWKQSAELYSHAKPCVCNPCLCIPQVHLGYAKFALALIQVLWGKTPTAAMPNIVPLALTQAMWGKTPPAALLTWLSSSSSSTFEKLDTTSCHLQLLWLLLVLKSVTSFLQMPSLLDMVSCPCSDSSDAANSCLHAHDSFVHRHQFGCHQPARQLLQLQWWSHVTAC